MDVDLDSHLPLLTDENSGTPSPVSSFSSPSGSSTYSSQLISTPLSWSTLDHPHPHQFGFFAVLPPRPQSLQHIRDARQIFKIDDSDEEMDIICEKLSNF
jgi:hypothetical protein